MLFDDTTRNLPRRHHSSGLEIPIFTIIAIVLLKLTNRIKIRWIWLLAPIWLPMAAYAVVLLLAIADKTIF